MDGGSDRRLNNDDFCSQEERKLPVFGRMLYRTRKSERAKSYRTFPLRQIMLLAYDTTLLNQQDPPVAHLTLASDAEEDWTAH